MQKAKVSLWTTHTSIVKMQGKQSYDDHYNRTGLSGLENVCTVLSGMVPTSDVECLTGLIVETVRLSESMNETNAQMETRIYNAIMSHSIFAR